MAIWAAGEIWPHQWTANAMAWSITAMALLVMGVHHLRLHARHALGDLLGWSYRLARGASAIATAALVFSALPSFVFVP